MTDGTPEPAEPGGVSAILSDVGSDIETTRVTVGDLSFDATMAGPDDGAPVLLLHGFPRTAALWRSQLPALADAGHRAVAFDQRGYSPGARPADDDAYRLPHLGGDVLAVADALGIDRFHLVGHDWGGFVAWWVAANRPDRLASVAVLSTPHPAAFLAALRFGDQRRRSAYIPLFGSRVGGTVLGGAGNLGLRLLLAASRLPGVLRAEPLTKAHNDPGWLAAALAWYRANTVAALRAVGPSVVPTLYLWGADDPALGPHAAYGTGAHVTAPYRFVPLPGIGHWLPDLAADVVTRELLDHIEAATWA